MARPIDPRFRDKPSPLGAAGRSSATRALRGCARRVRRILGRIAVIAEEAEALELELATIARELRDVGVGDSLGDVSGAISKARAEHRLKGAMRAAAARGVRSVEVRFRPNRSAIARVDGIIVQLPPGPAAVLSVLSRAESGAGDGFPGLIPRSVFAAELTKEVGRALSRQAVTELVYRLKVALLDAGLSPFLVESVAGRGIRLRYRPSSRAASVFAIT